MTDLRNRMLGLFMAGWLRVRSVAHPVHRGRESAAGHAAALTVRRLSALLGNALVTEMRSLGFEQLLILLSSPEWLESRISQRARSIAFEVQPDERESWARPQSIDEGGNDSDLRGVPGGAARRAVELFRREGLTVVSASPGIRQTVQWQALEEGSRAFARPASNIVGSLEVLVEYGGRVKARSRARQALLQEYGAELRWLETTEGQQAIAGRRLEYPLVEIQDFGAVAAGLQDAIRGRPIVPVDTPRLRSPGGFPPFTPGEREADAGWVVVDDVDRLEIEVTDDAARNEGQADAPEPPAADAPQQKKSGSMGVLLGGIFAAGLGLTAWTRWRRRHG